LLEIFENAFDKWFGMSSFSNRLLVMTRKKTAISKKKEENYIDGDLCFAFGKEPNEEDYWARSPKTKGKEYLRIW
jgi:hypothetical protein